MATITKAACPKCTEFIAAGVRSPGLRCEACGGCRTHRACKCTTCDNCMRKQPPKAYCVCCTARGRHNCVECHTPGTAMREAHATFPARSCDFGESTSTFVHNKLTRSLGLELEISDLARLPENTRSYNLFSAGWTRDGSVKPSGMELVSRKLTGDQYLQACGQFLHVLHGTGATANETCGFHVHVDAADLSMFELRQVLLVWEACQPLVWGTLVERSREQSIYCTPTVLGRGQRTKLWDLRRSSDIYTWFCTWLYGLDNPRESLKDLGAHERASALRRYNSQIQAKRGHKYENAARRQAFNMHAWMMRGAVEFRLKEGTVDPETILFWPLWCGWFVEYAARLTEAEARVVCEAPPKTILELTEQFPRNGRTAVLKWVQKVLKAQAGGE